MPRFLIVLLAGFALSAAALGKPTLRIAVASNFHPTLVQIAAVYQESHPDTELTLIPGSSGKLYAQISNGATFDAFFSADSERPQKLENAGIALADTRFTFALGILAFWQPGSPAADLSKTQTLALANPKLAPFGLAATQARDSLPFPPHRSVTASSVSQAFTFAQSGAADSAFVSYSQLRQLEIPAAEYILIDPERYAPIEQQAIALKASPQLLEFLAYCQGPEAQATIAAAGYRVP